VGQVSRGGGVVLAVDGGNSKTDVAVVDTDGRVRARARGAGLSAHAVGLTAAVDGIEALVVRALADAGLHPGHSHVLRTAAYLAGVDLPRERAEMTAALTARGWAAATTVDNDAFAVLRSGSGGDGVAVVCGGGINAVAVHRGRSVRFPSLGVLSGDWGGGQQLGAAALGAAARHADGRGPRTALHDVVLAHFGATRVLEVIEAVHFGAVPIARLGELAPGVFTVAPADAVAAALVTRLAEEAAAYALAALPRLGVTAAEEVRLVLGGGIFRGQPAFADDVGHRVRADYPLARTVVASADPVLGAAALGLDALRG
jgi:N-acetylglucosamine kinase-like BadF-type ATPase